MKPIELERWEPAPDDPRRKVYAGQRTAQEVFEELRYRLEGMGYLPDEYLFMDRGQTAGRSPAARRSSVSPITAAARGSIPTSP